MRGESSGVFSVRALPLSSTVPSFLPGTCALPHFGRVRSGPKIGSHIWHGADRFAITIDLVVLYCFRSRTTAWLWKMPPLTQSRESWLASYQFAPFCAQLFLAHHLQGGMRVGRDGCPAEDFALAQIGFGIMQLFKPLQAKWGGSKGSLSALPDLALRLR